MENNVLFVERTFGDLDVPLLKRDFRIVGIPNSPFGTIPELVKLIKDKDLSFRRIVCGDDVVGAEYIVVIDDDFNFSVPNSQYNENVSMNEKRQKIRQCLREMAKERGLPYNVISVRADRGTASGWTIVTPEPCAHEILEDFDLVYGHGGIKELISPGELHFYYEKAIDYLQRRGLVVVL